MKETKSVKGLMHRINEQGWKDLKILAAEQGITMNALVVEALNDLLRKHGKKPTIENPLLT